MTIDAWLPVGHSLPDGTVLESILHEGEDWQIYQRRAGGLALLARERLAKRWLDDGLLEESLLVPVIFGDEKFLALSNDDNRILCPVKRCKSPGSKIEALAFAIALRETRASCVEESLHNSIYVEKYSRLLPTYSLASSVEDEVVLGSYLTGGVQVPVRSFRRLHALMTWLPREDIREIIRQAGVEVPKQEARRTRTDTAEGAGESAKQEPFELTGRPDLEKFFQEHVIDIVENPEQYATLGVDFPSPIVLHGPPGCGKTFSVDALIDYLEWPSFEIDCGSVGSPFIHETGRKIIEVFEKAAKNAPSVLVVDEMEAFLADRELGAASGLHRVEEVAEFLRRIPDSPKNEILVIAMTNRIGMIDSAILRRGRFDHVINVDMPSAEEVEEVLRKLMQDLPQVPDLDLSGAVKKFSGRPLSDVAFVVREAARLAARAGKDRIDNEAFQNALTATSPRPDDDQQTEKIGFN